MKYPFYQCFISTESFDYQLQGQNSLEHEEVLPGAEQYTLCFWMRLVNNWVEDESLAETSARLVNLRMFAVSGVLFLESIYVGWKDEFSKIYVEHITIKKFHIVRSILSFVHKTFTRAPVRCFAG